MADRAAEKAAERESEALRKLQAAAGMAPARTSERIDWMYEQGAAQVKPSEDELMNKPVSGQVDKDLKDVHSLKEGTAGSLFLRSATGTSEDMLRKIREDPLFQIKRQEQAAKESMMQNPLVMARMQERQKKAAKKEAKEAKKAAKKEKKAMKKAAKKEKKDKKAAKKAGGKKSSSSSSSSASDAPPMMAQPVGLLPREEPGASPAPSRASVAPKVDMSSLGPSASLIGKREEHAARIAKQRDEAFASRGAPRRMSEEEKKRRLEQMESDAKRHEASKDQRIANAAKREKEIEEQEAQARAKGDNTYMKKFRNEAYLESEGSMADRLKTQRHRRQKGLNDP
eukprot:CAMPEP_0178421934 /NCGR_PEP_ID=MMETSP0689_2-20121128/26907_1 /TAXON_ID=160604 /ORGANISM="Amphidinium massartii, Strain CS-259" /LENGTH=340 /DNA_ID=CAMNT_0020043469 /DNA_START=71 /DNA_END=1090 /DNA_ORIENTATION=+